jgi:hypothetical protein
MRDPAIVEEELASIAAMADEATKFDAIVAWCATHPDEVPFAIHALLVGRYRRAEHAGKQPEHASDDLHS